MKGDRYHPFSCALLRVPGIFCVGVLFLLLGIRCKETPTGGEEDPAPATDHRGRAALLKHGRHHSTFADTTGLAHDLDIIERKLGLLDTGIRDHLEAVEITYYTFTDSTFTTCDTAHLCSGILLVHACMADEVRAIFDGLRRDNFPIAKVIPINRYGLNADSTGWDDMASMVDNNTSAFNYRSKAMVPETSKHAQGIAIDINPLLNPLVRHVANGTTYEPPGAHYDPARPGTLTRSQIMKHLAPIGWTWGGRWRRPQDHQHIEKAHPVCEHLRERVR